MIAVFSRFHAVALENLEDYVRTARARRRIGPRR
jgi:hypothetical protein